MDRRSSAVRLPGVANATGLDVGLDRFKFFPAAAIGGLTALRAYAAVFGDVRFCPTGGIGIEAAPQWLAEPAVLCIGGSWLVPRGPVDPVAIRDRAEHAVRVLRPAAPTPDRDAGVDRAPRDDPAHGGS